MAASIPPMLKYSIVHNLLNFPPILIKFVSKIIVCKVLYLKAQYLLRLRSPLGFPTQATMHLIRLLISHKVYNQSEKTTTKKNKNKNKTIIQCPDKNLLASEKNWIRTLVKRPYFTFNFNWWAFYLMTFWLWDIFLRNESLAFHTDCFKLIRQFAKNVISGILQKKKKKKTNKKKIK